MVVVMIRIARLPVHPRVRWGMNGENEQPHSGWSSPHPFPWLDARPGAWPAGCRPCALKGGAPHTFRTPLSAGYSRRGQVAHPARWTRLCDPLARASGLGRGRCPHAQPPSSETAIAAATLCELPAISARLPLRRANGVGTVQLDGPQLDALPRRVASQPGGP